MNETSAIVEAIRDLTRVTIALSGKFETRADAIRKLLALAIPPSRVASILAIDIKVVTSIQAKDKKKLGANREASDGQE